MKNYEGIKYGLKLSYLVLCLFQSSCIGVGQSASNESGRFVGKKGAELDITNSLKKVKEVVIRSSGLLEEEVIGIGIEGDTLNAKLLPGPVGGQRNFEEVYSFLTNSRGEVLIIYRGNNVVAAGHSTE